MDKLILIENGKESTKQIVNYYREKSLFPHFIFYTFDGNLYSYKEEIVKLKPISPTNPFFPKNAHWTKYCYELDEWQEVDNIKCAILEDAIFET